MFIDEQNFRTCERIALDRIKNKRKIITKNYIKNKEFYIKDDKFYLRIEDIDKKESKPFELSVKKII